jgi:predicted RNA binding protein YcfA (HicA-like mRNA interferase family)
LLSAKELRQFLEKEGFLFIRQKGSHCFYRHPDGRTTTVPVHPGKDIKRALLRVILNEIHMSRDDFFKKMRR